MARMRRKQGYARSLGIVLFLLSAAFLLLPASWTSPLISLVQVLVPFADAVDRAADGAARLASSASKPVAFAEFEALRLEKEALMREVASLTVRNLELGREVALLTATREWATGDAALGPRGRLIPAPVLHDDLLPWRDSRLVAAGSYRGVRRGAPVASATIAVSKEGGAGARPGWAVLHGESLIGFVEQVGSHTARVRLLSDSGNETKVRVGRFQDGQFTLCDRYYWLVGLGGIMEFRDVDRREMEEGAIQAGDLVLSDPGDDRLPAAMIIGVIERLSPRRDNPLLATATVRPSVDRGALRRVYIYDPRATEQGAAP